MKNQEERLRMAIKLKNMQGHFGDIVAIYDVVKLTSPYKSELPNCL